MERRAERQALPMQERQELVASRVPEAILARGGQADAALSQVIQRPRLSQEIGVVEVCCGLQDSQLFGCASFQHPRGRTKRRSRTWHGAHGDRASTGQVGRRPRGSRRPRRA